MKSVAVFFYGLFMDESLLLGKGVRVLESRMARLDNYRLSIGARARLVPAQGRTVYGMLMRMPIVDLKRLYSEPSVSGYISQDVRVTSSDAETTEAICYNLPESLQDFRANPAYAKQLHDLAAKLGLPAEYLASIERAGTDS